MSGNDKDDSASGRPGHTVATYGFPSTYRHWSAGRSSKPQRGPNGTYEIVLKGDVAKLYDPDSPQAAFAMWVTRQMFAAYLAYGRENRLRSN
jgi:spore cortex formation protein SpoVR/YcgB (stage V sporulation)